MAIAALTFVMASTPQDVRATDYGSSNSIAALRYDVPRLLAQPLTLAPLFVPSASPDHRNLVLDMIYTNGTEAAVSWHAGHARGLIILRFNRGMWWWVAGAATVNNDLTYWTSLSSPGQEVTECGASRLKSPTTDEILSANLISEPFARGLAHYLKVWRASVALGQPVTSCDYFTSFGDTNDGYVTSLVTPRPLKWTSMRGSVPLTSQMPPIYYTVTLSTHSSSPIEIEAGSVLRVWFPFVLDPQKRYTLLLREADPTFEPVNGSLENNTLTFTLRDFSIPAGNTLHAEVTAK